MSAFATNPLFIILLAFGVLTQCPNLQAYQQESLVEAPSIKPWMADFRKDLPPLPEDRCSNAEPANAITEHLIWSVTPNFESKQLAAMATYTYLNKIEGNDILVLDVSADMTINHITVNGELVQYEIRRSDVSFRSNALRIPIPGNVGKGEVTIDYITSKSASGIFWVDAEQTNGKKHPFLYTLFEPNEGASAIPGQHSPQIRQTFEVNVYTGSPDLMAMSSVPNNPTVRNDTGDYVGLKLERAVPLYLLSLHVGNFVYRESKEDSRLGVYSEETMIDTAAEVLINLPKFLRSAEEICGPYNWWVYRPIFLPYAFPYMAMEHPCASTCSQICLERPNVVPHELSHSWAGNDITNGTWRQFFWNEGLTCFIEYHINEKIWGTDFASLLFVNRMKEMQIAVNDYYETRPDLLRLCQQTDDYQFTRVPYSKGALFFFMLKNAMGETDFNVFLKDYMKVFFQNTMSDNRFLEFLRLWLVNEKQMNDFDQFMSDHQINKWFYGIDTPSNAPVFTSALMEALENEVSKVLNLQPVNAELVNSWNASIMVSFFGLLHENSTPEQLAHLDEQLHFTQAQMMTIREEWALLCAKRQYITPEITRMIAEYLYERNSKHKANQIATALSKYPEGLAVIEYILSEDNGRLFTLTRQSIEEKRN